MYKQQKKQYLNYIILSNGSSIKKNSFKNKKVLELLKDNYSFSYISQLNNKNLLNISEKTSTYTFLKKFKNN
jgi:hypothetical protein